MNHRRQETKAHQHSVAGPDIWIGVGHIMWWIQTFGWGRQFNVSQYLTFISSFEGAKVNSQTKWGSWPDFPAWIRHSQPKPYYNTRAFSLSHVPAIILKAFKIKTMSQYNY